MWSTTTKVFPGGASGNEPACQCRRVRDPDLIAGSGRSPRGGHGNPLQYSRLENPTDRIPWIESHCDWWTGLKWLSTHTHTHTITKLQINCCFKTLSFEEMVYYTALLGWKLADPRNFNSNLHEIYLTFLSLRDWATARWVHLALNLALSSVSKKPEYVLSLQSENA